MIGLDSNVVVRLLVQDDQAQVARARRLVEECLEAGETCLVTTATLCELEWVLESVYGASRTDVAAAVRSLLTTPPFEVEDRALVERALRRYAKDKGDLSDHLIGQIGRARGARTTYTFDRALKRAEGFTLV